MRNLSRRIGSDKNQPGRLWKVCKRDGSQDRLHVVCPVGRVQDMPPEQARCRGPKRRAVHLREDSNHRQELRLNLVNGLSCDQTASNEPPNGCPYDKVETLANRFATRKFNVAKDL